MPIPAGGPVAVGWSPTLDQTAVYAPWLTISVSTPGAQVFLNTFTDDTSPNAAVAQQHIADAVTLIGTLVTTMPAALYPLAATVAARYAAATLAVAYARSDDDVRRATALMATATTGLKGLQDAADNAGVAALSPQPVLSAPDPVPWGDSLLIDGTYSTTSVRTFWSN